MITLIEEAKKIIDNPYMQNSHILAEAESYLDNLMGWQREEGYQEKDFHTPETFAGWSCNGFKFDLTGDLFHWGKLHSTGHKAALSAKLTAYGETHDR